MRLIKKILLGTTLILFVATGNAMCANGGQTYSNLLMLSSAERGASDVLLFSMMMLSSTEGGTIRETMATPNADNSMELSFDDAISVSAVSIALLGTSDSDESQDTIDVQSATDSLTVYVSSPPDTISRITKTSVDRIESFRNRYDFAQIEESRLSIWDLISYWFRTLTSALPDNDMVRFLVYLIGGAVLLYLISWLVYRSFYSTYFRQTKVVQYGDAGGRFSSDSGGANPEDLLKNGDFRNAIRLMLIDSLQNLASEKMIALHKDKTNRDYLYELPEGAMREHFSTLSRIYNYVWYGEFEPAQIQVDAAQNAWKQLVNKEVR